MHYFAKFIFSHILNWNLSGNFPKGINKYIVIGVPHTSWTDFPLGLLIRSITKTRIHFVGKKALFKFPYGYFFRFLGGFPIDRTKSNNTVDLLIEKFNQNEQFILGISPEGTRKKVDHWKTGFYFIAKGAKIPIVKVALDYQNKMVTIADPYFTTENQENDLLALRNFYIGIKGRYPDLS